MSAEPRLHRYEVTFELPGWTLFVAELERLPGGEDGLAGLREETARRARQRFEIGTLAAEPAPAALRAAERAAGSLAEILAAAPVARVVRRGVAEAEPV